MEWQVVGVIVVLIGLVTAVVTPLIKLNTIVTKISVAVENLTKYIEKNDGCHKEFSEQLSDHETRITVIERTSKGAD